MPLLNPSDTLPKPTDQFYDDFPYDSVCFSQTHPSRLAAIAHLFGATGVPDIAHARILEVGCAAGGNLLPLAVAYPQATLLGIDLSARQIADGHRFLQSFPLPNLELRHANILDMNESWGQWDFIIAHGVYSWIPADVQRHLLASASKLLSPAGLMFVSFNVNPGWRLRGAVRDLMQYYSARFPDPMEKVRQARALVDFLADSMRTETDEPFVKLLRDESARMREYPDYYILHEYLEPCNEPLYFHEFNTRVEQSGLKYLGDTRPATMAAAGLARETEQGLRAISRDRIELEQFLDLLRSRIFREAILCQPSLPLDHNVTPDRLDALHLSAAIFPHSPATTSPPHPAPTPPATPPTPDAPPSPAAPPTPAALRTPDLELSWLTDLGREVTAREPLGKAILHALATAFPASLPYPDLVTAACHALAIEPTPTTRARIATITLGLIFGSSEIVEVLASPYPLAPTLSPNPRACPLAAHQSRTSDRVFSRRHRVVKLHDSYRTLLQSCTGQPQPPTPDLQKLARHALLIP